MRLIQSPYMLPSIAFAASSSLGFALPACAFDFKVSGQVDRAITAADNGKDSDVGFVDNTGSNSRFRFTGDQAMAHDLKAGFVYEIGLGTNKSSSFDINNGGGDNKTFLDNRLANIYLQGAFGRLTLGKVHGAADGTSELDYSGTTHLGGGSTIANYAGGLSFLDQNGQVISTLGKAMNQFDGLSRQNAIRYDSPSFNGLTLSASLDNGHAYELAPRYQTTFGSGGKFGFAADYLDSQSQGRDIDPDGTVVNTGRRFQEWGGSTSLLLANGLNFTASYKHRNYVDAGIPNADNYFGSVGYIMGRHHFALSYDQTNDLLNEGSKARAFGAAYVFNWSRAINLYASYHLYKLDDADPAQQGNPVNARNISQIYTGVRLKFL